jgi:hypothetical protein
MQQSAASRMGIAQSASIERAMHVHVVVHAAFHVLHVMAM